MVDITGATDKIQTEEVEFKAGVSEGTFNKMGAAINNLLDGQPSGVSDSNITMISYEDTYNSFTGYSISTSWSDFPLSHQTGDTTFCTLDAANNEVDLIAGAYFVEFHTHGYHTQACTAQTRFRNISDGTTDILGQNMIITSTATGGCHMSLSGVVEIASTKSFSLQAVCGAGATINFGAAWAGTAKPDSENNVWMQMKIQKLT